jgi:hypothetical protein
MAWFTIDDGIRSDEIEATDETEAKMVFIERYDLGPREHDFVRATPQPAPTMTPIEQRIRDDEAAGVNLIKCTECRKKVHLRRARLGLCFPCHDAMYDGASADSSRRPECPLVGEDGNVFAVIGRVRRCLERDGQPERAREFVERATSSTRYDAVLKLTFEYVDPM